MRCIEMTHLLISLTVKRWLIETWDVLKLPNKLNGATKELINRNMRCIEILQRRADYMSGD